MKRLWPFIVVAFLMTGCQSYNEYYESQYKGQPLEERLKVKRTGVPDWSEGKSAQVNGAKVGL